MNSQPDQLRKQLHKTVRRKKVEVLQLFGSLTSMKRTVPNFIIIGSQRSGTTSLYNYLSGHPDILPSIVKEVHYFDFNFHKGFNWYRGHFPYLPDRKGGQKFITGEASPYYVYHPLAPIRISKSFPTIKMILLLRNPVNRAFSHYQHEVGLGFEQLSFEEAIDQESSRLDGEVEKMTLDETYRSFNHQHYSYLSRGVYVEQLKNWMKLFPREQIQIIKSEDFFESPPDVVSQVVKFLDLPEWRLSKFKVHNRLQYQGMDPNTRERLIAYYEPFNQCLYEYLGTDFGWNRS